MSSFRSAKQWRWARAECASHQARHRGLPPREHGPPHVHVERAGTEATIWLVDASVRTAGNMRAADLSRAQAIVASRRGSLMRAWRRYHEED
jgi:hypothetical protein